jgi:hypothetical protein
VQLRTCVIFSLGSLSRLPGDQVVTIYEQNRQRWEAAALSAVEAWRGGNKYRAAVDFVSNTFPAMLKQLDADTQSIDGLRAKVKVLSDALNAAGISPHDVLEHAASKPSSVPLSGGE